MILITLGTQDKKFHRLLHAVQKQIDNKFINEEVIVQAGVSCDFKSDDMKIFDLIPLDEFDSKLTELGELLGGTELDATSEEITEILKSGDKHIKESGLSTDSVDEHGFIRMKEELESMGLVVAYKVFELPGFDVVVAIWEDKNEIPPLYVEVTVSEHEG